MATEKEREERRQHRTIMRQLDEDRERNELNFALLVAEFAVLCTEKGHNLQYIQEQVAAIMRRRGK